MFKLQPQASIHTIIFLPIITTYALFCLLSRSTDYGTTYEKLNDKVGLKTVLSYFYVCPTNKRKVREI